ncbi:hypothetical protein M5D96_005841 [Drosophila gunungcola]|uniref:Uncharacterized protein n=2 Tax=Drosophila gunungcola TaxID=103775 RepID=A0A9P9YR57_9MUSC|nr:hypothetical protein M5D96_005841 [Drosophila gunungcola]
MVVVALLVVKIFSVIMFLRTAIYIWNVKRNIRRLTEEQETTTTCLNFDSETYIQFLRISFIMGVNWLLEFFFVIASVFWPGTCGVAKQLNLYSGLIIFDVLILKRSTINMFMDSTHIRPLQQCARTQTQIQPA